MTAAAREASDAALAAGGSDMAAVNATNALRHAVGQDRLHAALALHMRQLGLGGLLDHSSPSEPLAHGEALIAKSGDAISRTVTT